MVRLCAFPCLMNVVCLSATVAAGENAKSPERILQSYVADFRHDPAAAESFTFGVRVTGEGGGDWHVVVSGKKGDAEEMDVTLKPGFPAEPVAYYKLDLATLRKIDRGELNALTAMAKARGGDPVPMDLDLMPGFQPSPGFLARIVPFSFHFWTRGFPERVPFSGELGRVTHGANAVIFYYQKGLRSGWFQVNKGQHVNEDPEDQTNPFPTMFFMLRGKLQAKVGGKQVTFPENEMMFVPAGVTHEFWNPYDNPAEFIILMFGEGA